MTVTEALLDQCESPIERQLVRELGRALLPDVEVTCQREIRALGKYHRVDFYIEHAGKRLVIECDGRQFHNFRADKERDGRLLADGGVDMVIRFRGCDILYLPEMCINAIDAFAAPLVSNVRGWKSLEEMAQAAFLTMRTEHGAKPIVRARTTVDDLVALPAALRDCHAFSYYGANMVPVAYSRCSNPNTASSSEPLTVHRLGDMVDEVAREIRKEAGL
jgi:very-short-patch-repair endonuclease